MFKKTFSILLVVALIFTGFMNFPASSYAAGGDPTIAEYKFENNANDSSGNNKHGTIHGGVTYEDTGSTGKAAVFDGTGYIELPQDLIKDNTEFTISAMFKTSTEGAILGYQNEPALTGNADEWQPIIYIDKDGKLRATIWTISKESVKFTTSFVVNDGNWHKVNLSLGANLFRLYVDDKLIGWSNSEIDHLSQSYNQLGLADSRGYPRANNNWFYFSGMLDEFKIVAGSFTIDTLSHQAATPLTVGYGSGTQEIKTITIKNSGTGALDNVSVALSEADADAFEITQPTTTNLASGASTSFTVKAKDGLEASTYTATVTVTATNMTNESFKVTQFVDTLPVPPSAVGNIVVSAGDQYATLNWDTVTGATYYNLYNSTVSGQYGDATVTTVTDATYTYHNLTNGTPYYFVIKAGNAGGASVDSNEVSATPATVPTAPTNVAAVAGNGQATVSYTPPADNGGSVITEYEVTSSPGDVVVTGTTSPITVTGLTNGTTYTFTVKAINAKGESDASVISNEVTPQSPPSGGNGSELIANPSKPSNNVEIIVNGRVENAGIATTTVRNEQTVTTVVVDQKLLVDKLANEGLGAVVTIPVNNESDVVVGVFNGQMVKNLESKQAIIEIKTDNATYTLPAHQINIDSISGQLGTTVGLQDIEVHIEIAEPAADTVQLVANAASANEFSIVVPPLNFTVTAKYKDQTIEVSRFQSYVERTVLIPDGADPGKITTGVVVEPDGSVRHVPTKVVEIDGKYYAVINSLTNSTYTVVWHPVTYRDVANHWAKDAINNLGSRMVVSGSGDDLFNPDQDITRAEFTAIIVGGLGLRLEQGTTSFSDVRAKDWFHDTVQTAHLFGLVNGFEDGSFRPHDKISREQAMVIIANAMKITHLQGSGRAQAANLDSFADVASISSWAKRDVASSIQVGIVSGRGHGMLAPQAFVTRAEVATMVQSLLQKSALIDK